MVTLLVELINHSEDKLVDKHVSIVSMDQLILGALWPRN
jgi:hypothetical protein